MKEESTPGPGHFGKNLERHGKRHIGCATFGRTKEQRLYTANNEVTLRQGVLVLNTDCSARERSTKASLLSRRSSNLLGDHLSSSRTATLKESTTASSLHVKSIEANVLRRTPTFSTSKSQGPTEWEPHSSRGGLQSVYSPGPKYDTSSSRVKPISVPKDTRSQYLARVPAPSPTRGSGDFNNTSSGGADRLLVYPCSTYHSQPGPADYRVEKAFKHVARNTCTNTAPKWKEHTTKPLKTQPHRLRSTFSDIQKAKLVEDPKVVMEVLHKLEEHMQFSMLSVSDTLRMFDKDGSGALSAWELESALADMKLNLSSRELNVLLAHLDKDGDMEIDLEEMTHALNNFRKDNKSRHNFKKIYEPGKMKGREFKSVYAGGGNMPADIWETAELKAMRLSMWKRSREGRKAGAFR